MSTEESQRSSALEARYTRREAERRARVAQLKSRELLVSLARLATFVLFGVGLWLVVQGGTLSPWWLVVPGLAFVALVLIHPVVLRRRESAERAVEFYERGRGRLRDPASSKASDGSRFVDPKHIYANDLDLFGPGSIFQRLNMARTSTGEDTLAVWLLEPAAVETIKSRQVAVAELGSKLDLRETLYILGSDVADTVEPHSFQEWARPEAAGSHDLGSALGVRMWLGALAVANVLSLVGVFSFGWMAAIPLATVLASIATFAVLRARLAALTAGVDQASREVAVLASLLQRLESESFDAPLLRALCAELFESGRHPAQRLGELRRLVDLRDSQRNPLFGPIGALVLWGSQISLAIGRWRRRYGDQIAIWLEHLGTVEALASFGTYQSEQTQAIFPELSESGGRLLDGVDLAHPLLPAEVRIPNSIRLDDSRRVALVSGSNMSGKSTYLRTIGVNVALALAGAPVIAKQLRLSPLRVAASIQVQDSLQEGASRFYAEILRLRQVLDETEHAEPVLFLLDEVLHGTNSHDRRIGAEAVVVALTQRGAIGLVTTHDLALAKIAEERGDFFNVHFEDTIEDGKILFDYRLRQGVVTRSNALALMREVGLEV